MQSGLEPACAKACPTESIKFGTIEELHRIANERVQQLNAQARDAGRPEDAYLYGADDSLLGGLNSFFLLVDRPEVYHLPAQAKLPSKDLPAASALGIGGTLGMAALGAVAFRKRRMDAFAEAARTRVAGSRSRGCGSDCTPPTQRPRHPEAEGGRAMTDLLLQVAPPSNTWFTDSPEWGWYIVVYFFLGGIAGGAAFLSGLLDLLGNRLDRRMTRIGY